MGDDRSWDGLMPDALGLIFRKLLFQEILRVVPMVCKSWANVVRGPYCWYEIDIEEWSRSRGPRDVDQMLQMLISRSGNTLRKLRVYGLSNDNTLSLIADNAESLQDLHLPLGDMGDSIIEQVAPRLSNVASLDLSSCTKIGPAALEALGKHCKSLTTLLRNMHPWEVLDPQSQDSEAQVIAATMPNLRRLELAYSQVSTESVVRLMTSLRDLEVLDVKGCWDVKLGQDLLDMVPKLRVVGPRVSGSYATDNWGWDSDEVLEFDDQWGSAEDSDNISRGGEDSDDSSEDGEDEVDPVNVSFQNFGVEDDDSGVEDNDSDDDDDDG